MSLWPSLLGVVGKVAAPWPSMNTRPSGITAALIGDANMPSSVCSTTSVLKASPVVATVVAAAVDTFVDSSVSAVRTMTARCAVRRLSRNGSSLPVAHPPPHEASGHGPPAWPRRVAVSHPSSSLAPVPDPSHAPEQLDPAERVEQLRATIRYHNRRYYEL